MDGLLLMSDTQWIFFVPMIHNTSQLFARVSWTHTLFSLAIAMKQQRDYKHKNISRYLLKISPECIKYQAISMYGASIHLISRHSFSLFSPWMYEITFRFFFLSVYFYRLVFHLSDATFFWSVLVLGPKLIIYCCKQ